MDFEFGITILSIEAPEGKVVINMGEVSEMTIYSQFLEDVKYKYPSLEDYAWGEELIDYKITVYKNDKSTIPDYSIIKDDLIKVGLVTVNKKVAGMLSIIDALYDTASEMIYMKEKVFNQSWHLLRKSILKGMNNSQEICKKNNIFQPEDILILDYLDKGASKAYVNNLRQIEYQAVNSSSEIGRLKAARQRMMDDPKFIYVYSTSGGHIHDKLCNEVKNITDENFRASEVFPEGRTWCSRCRRINVIRRGCSLMVKQIPFCDHIFRENNVSLGLLEHMIELGCTFNASDLSCLQVKGIEDNWEIRFTQNGPTLWHNNYIRTSDTERYITDGFHKQGFNGKNVNKMLNYILNYTWEKHLEGEALKKAREEAMSVVTEVAPEIKEERSILKRIVDFIKAIVGRK